MAISEITANRNTNGGPASTSIVFTYISTPTEDNLLVAAFSWRGNTTITGTPSGWTQANSRLVNTNINSAVFYKIAGASEPLGHTWTIGASFKSAGCASEWSGIDTSAPFDKTNVNGASSGTAGTTGLSGTLVQADELVVAAFFNNTNATWSAHDNGLTEILEASSTGGGGATRNTTSLATKIATATTSVNYGATLSATNEWDAIVATFKGAAAGTFKPYLAVRQSAMIGAR